MDWRKDRQTGPPMDAGGTVPVRRLRSRGSVAAGTRGESNFGATYRGPARNGGTWLELLHPGTAVLPVGVKTLWPQYRADLGLCFLCEGGQGFVPLGRGRVVLKNRTDALLHFLLDRGQAGR